MSIRLDYDLTGLDTLQRRLDSALDGLARDTVIATGKVVKARAKQGPFKDHTHQLRSTISDRYIGKRGPWHLVIVKAPMFYASFVERGTEPHDIPKPARPPGKPLHFYWERRGVWFTGYGVHHSGSRAYAFMEPAADYGRRYIKDFVQRGFAGIATRMESYV